LQHLLDPRDDGIVARLVRRIAEVDAADQQAPCSFRIYLDCWITYQ